ncbi:GNAT family N-acetyltransferase [Peribacillus frigoritolerans]|uniref:GNAT family N-acetyltransferase n=1 Tax=Peribacillus frigoritolerans TaxID=450367 RepID=UPI00381D6664
MDFKLKREKNGEVYMISIVKKQEFCMFEDKMSTDEFSLSDEIIMETFHQFIDDYEDDEIDVYGYFDKTGDLVGLIRFSEETGDLLFESIDNLANSFFTLIGVLFVQPNYRKKGIGKELVEFAISKATTKEIVAYPIDIEASNFFNSIGFSLCKNIVDCDDHWLIRKR